VAKLSIVGQTTIRTVKNQFREALGVNIEIYDQSGNTAPENVTLGSIRTKKPTAVEINVVGQTLVKNVEAFFKDNYGVKIDILAADGTLADNNVTLGSVRRQTQNQLLSDTPDSKPSEDAANSKTDTVVDLESATEAQRTDREILLAAVSESGRALEYASDELRADREIVLAAVSEDGDALKFASDDLKADREIVLAAVADDGYCLKYAAGQLTQDPEILAAAINTNRSSCPFIYVTENNETVSQLAKKAYFADTDPLQCFFAVNKFLTPTPDVLDRAFGCHDFDSFDKEKALENYEDDQTEKLWDLLDDHGIFEMSVGDEKTVGCGEVDITCWHVLEGPKLDDFFNRLYFYVLRFQAENLHAVGWVEFEENDDGTANRNDRIGFQIVGNHGDGPISENAYCGELLEHLEEDSDSENLWEEEDN